MWIKSKIGCAIIGGFSVLVGLGINEQAVSYPNPTAQLPGDLAMGLHHDWTLVCDNLAVCVLLGLPRQSGVDDAGGSELPLMGLRLEYDPANTDAHVPAIDVFPIRRSGEVGALGGMPFKFSFGSVAGDRASELARDYAVGRLSPREATYVVQTLASRQKISGFDPSSHQPSVRFAGRGFKAALRNLKDRQGRLLFQQASKTLNKSVDAYPIQNPFTPAGLVPFTRARVSCPDQSSLQATRYELDHDFWLWGVTCESAISQETSGLKTTYYFEQHDDETPVAIDLPDLERKPIHAGVNGIPHAKVDPVRGTLSSCDLGGIWPECAPECAIARTWVRDHAGWQLTERRVIPHCGSIPEVYWFRTFKRPVNSLSGLPKGRVTPPHSIGRPLK